MQSKGLSPTEAGVVAVVYSMIIGMVVLRTVKLRDLPDMMLGTATMSAAILMIIYSVPFLVIGVYTAFSVESMADLVVNDPNFSSYADAYGLTYDEVCEYFEYAGYAFILSSVLGLISALCCWKRSHFWVALVFCILSVFTGAAGFVAMFMGLIALWMIIAARGRFVEYEKNFEEILSKIE